MYSIRSIARCTCSNQKHAGGGGEGEGGGGSGGGGGKTDVHEAIAGHDYYSSVFFLLSTYLS